jgi:hypothetical protein
VAVVAVVAGRGAEVRFAMRSRGVCVVELHR